MPRRAHRWTLLALVAAGVIAAGAAWRAACAPREEARAEAVPTVERAPLAVGDAAGEGEAGEDAYAAAELAGREAARRAALQRNDLALERLEAGEVDRAVALLREAAELQPHDEAFRVNLARALVRRGREEMRRGRLDDALATLAEAGEAHADRGLSAYWSAQVHLRRGARARAAEILEQARAEHPAVPALWRASGDVAWVRGDLDAAVEAYRRAHALDPEDAGTEERLAQLEEERRAFARYLTDRTAHFDTRYDPDNEEVVRSVPELHRDLEEAWTEVVARLGVQPQERILVLWLDPERYRGDAPPWSRGLYDGRIRLVVEDYARERERIRRTLRHELTHAVLHALDAEVPTWLHEGMAQLMEGHDPQVARAWLREREELRLDAGQLDGDWARWTDPGRVREAYFTAMSLCTWLREEYGDGVLVTLFQEMRGSGFAAAWRRTFPHSFAEVERRHRAALRE